MTNSFLQKLDQAASSIRASALYTALAWSVSLVIGLITLLVLVDSLGRFTDPGLRWLSTGTLVAAATFVFLKARDYYRSSQATQLSVAQELERLHPDLGSRLASAVEFAGQESEDLSAGSAELRRAVVIEAATQSEGIDFSTAINRGPFRRALRTALGVSLPAMVFAILAWPTFSLGLQRLAAPWARLDWPRQHVLELVDPVTAIAAGTQFEAIAIDHVGTLPDDIQIEYRFAATSDTPERVESQAMRLVGDQAIATRENIREPFSYRVTGGDDQTMPWRDLEVHDPPRAVSLDISINPPAYSGLAPSSQQTGPLRVLEATKLQLSGKASEPLTGAQLGMTDAEPIQLTVSAEAGEAFFLGSKEWIARAPEEAASAQRSYQITLENKRGLSGTTRPAPYQVVVDKPPKVSWSGTSEDQFVTARAIVPIQAALEDDFALARAELRWQAIALDPETGADEDSEDQAKQPPTDSIPLYAGPTEPPSRESLDEGQRLAIQQDLDLAELGYSPGLRLDLVVAARDYKPLEGAVELPRRIFLVSDEEYEQRFASKQSKLLAEVLRALDLQRDAQQFAQELGADVEAANEIDRALRDRMTSLTYAQRQATDSVDDPQSGAAELARSLTDELRRNRLERPELLEQLERVSGELTNLGQGALSDALRSATGARREANRGSEPESVAEPLAKAEQFQAEAVQQLEQIAEQLTGWADYQRFAREVAQLQEKQEGLAAKVAKELAKAQNSPLSKAARQANRQKLVAEQAETRRRFETLRQSMQELLDSTNEESKSASESVADALDTATEQDISGNMRAASRDLALGRLGSATRGQQQAAEGLSSMLEALRQRATSDPKELIKRLREAQRELAEMERRAEELSQQSDAGKKQEELKRDAERMSRQLQRLTASQAAGSAQQASDNLGQEGQQPSESQVSDAKQSLKEAQEQIEQRINELEEEETQKALDRLKEKMPDFIARQQQVLDRTLKLEQASQGASAKRQAQIRRAASSLTGDQEMLQDEIHKAAIEVASREVFELAMRGVETDMKRAAAGLAAVNVGRKTQRHEFSALQRLKHIAEVLEQNQQLQEQQQSGGGGGGGGGGNKPPSPIDVAELKMLRLMQLDLLSRTDMFEADYAEARESSPQVSPKWNDEAENLANEQRRLAELALEMAARNNDPDAQPQPPAEDQE